MATITFIGWYGFIQALERKGFTHQQAEGAAEAVDEFVLGQVASKADLKELAHSIDAGMRRQTITTVKWVAGFLLAHAIGTAALTVALIQLLQ